MKRVLCVLLAIFMLSTMVACNNADKPVQTNPVTPDSGEVTVQPTTEAITPTTKAEDSLDSFKFPTASVFCKVPAECGRMSNGRVVITTGHDEYTGTVFYGAEDSYSGNLEGILSAVAAEYARDVNKYLAPDIEADALTVNSTEKVTVSGYEAVKFSAPITNKDGGTYHIYGYSMMINERPAMILGILRSEDQAQADLNAMMALVDQMAGSIFTE